MARRATYTGPDGPEVPLPRGDVTEAVVRVGDTVRRPHQPGSDAVARYLDHLERVGFDRAPRYLGRDRQGRDVLDFLAGAVPGARLPGWAVTDDVLAAVARLTRDLVAAGAGWLPGPEVRFPRDIVATPPVPLPAGEPLVVAHGDVTPQNVVFRDGAPWGVVDFDLAGRTTELTELANTAMHWVPLLDPADADPAFRAGGDVTVEDDGRRIARRLRVFLDAYGLPTARREAFLDAAALRFTGLPATMRWRAEHLGGGWARMWEAGVGDVLTRRVEWFTAVRADLAAALA